MAIDIEKDKISKYHRAGNPNMSAVNNKEHNNRVLKEIEENNKSVKGRLDQQTEMEQEIILRDALTSLDLRPAVNKEEGNRRVEEIVAYHKGKSL